MEQIKDCWWRRLNSWERKKLIRYWIGKSNGALPVDEVSGEAYWIKATRIRYATCEKELEFGCPSLQTICELHKK
jgi:hypothetical protein